MFDWLKKSSASNALDALISSAYGSNTRKRADLQEAIHLAYRDLLQLNISRDKIEQVARGLHAGRVPYSTHDLALSTALNFFRRSEFKDSLQEAQLIARAILMTWLEKGYVNSLIASTFEDAVYRTFAGALGKSKVSTSINREEIEAKLRKFFIRQHNTAVSAICFMRFGIDFDYHKKTQEAAFLLGALLSAGLSTNESELVYKGIVHSSFPEDAERILSIATDFLHDKKYEDLVEAGLSAFVRYDSNEAADEYSEDLLFALDFSDELKDLSLEINAPQKMSKLYSDLLAFGEEFKPAPFYASWLLQLAVVSDCLQNYVNDPDSETVDDLSRFKRFVHSEKFEETQKKETQTKILSICNQLMKMTDVSAPVSNYGHQDYASSTSRPARNDTSQSEQKVTVGDCVNYLRAPIGHDQKQSDLNDIFKIAAYIVELGSDLHKEVVPDLERIKKNEFTLGTIERNWDPKLLDEFRKCAVNLYDQVIELRKIMKKI